MAVEFGEQLWRDRHLRQFGQEQVQLRCGYWRNGAGSQLGAGWLGRPESGLTVGHDVLHTLLPNDTRHQEAQDIPGGHLTDNAYKRPGGLRHQLNPPHKPLQWSAFEQPEHTVPHRLDPLERILLPLNRDKAQELCTRLPVEVVGLDDRCIEGHRWQADRPVQVVGITQQLPDVRGRQRKKLLDDKPSTLPLHATDPHLLLARPVTIDTAAAQTDRTPHSVNVWHDFFRKQPHGFHDLPVWNFATSVEPAD